MKLWLLRPVDDAAGPWAPWYNKAFGFVVRAEDESAARALANVEAGDEVLEEEDAGAWTDPALSSCVELDAEGTAGVILRDFRAA